MTTPRHRPSGMRRLGGLAATASLVLLTLPGISNGAARPVHAELTAPLDAPWPLGTFTATADPPPPACPSGSTCSSFQVSCPSLIQANNGWLSVEYPADPPVGLVAFFTGRDGRLWLTAQNADMLAVLADLRARGLITVQVRWKTDWRAASPGESAGTAHIGCRPATVTRYLYDALYAPLGLSPAPGQCGFCITGNSGGSSQVAYPLAFYGLDDILSAVIPSGGPTYAALDKSCSLNHGQLPYQYSDTAREDIDKSFGFFAQDGPCYLHDASFTSRWQQESIATGGNDYYHPTTRIQFLFGDEDVQQQTVAGDYVNALLAAGSPSVSTAIVPNTPHQVFSTAWGRAAWEGAILAAPPTIDGFVPATAAAGSTVTVTGTGLGAATDVQFTDGVNAAFVVDSNTQITATVPPGAATGPITVATPYGSAVSTASFTPLADGAPAIDGFVPTTEAEGSVLTITGTGLGMATDVQFTNGVSAAFAVGSDTQITATVPSGAMSGPITVVTPYGSAVSTASFTVAPIQHVVVLFEEDHSFDNVLGKLCGEASAGQIPRSPCDGAATDSPATDYVPAVGDAVANQRRAIDHGLMDGFSSIPGCTPTSTPPSACYTQFDPSQIPNISELATAFAVSDRTFEFRSTPSWGGHMILASAGLDGFTGDNPTVSRSTSQRGPGWGCDSFRDARWWSGSSYVTVPACVPDQNGQGTYRSSSVPYVPTLFDRLDAAGRSWRIYGGSGSPEGAQGGYNWSMCPTFYECLGGPGRQNLVPAANVITDAAAGTLPSYAIVTPTGANSQHNGYSMAAGDSWIGSVVSAIENGPDWSSTALFLTWDDCGCFYDHVNPLQYDPNWGVREPMVIISPWAKPGATDSMPATSLSILAFTEGIYGLTPLGSSDANSYDYSGSFDYGQPPTPPVRMTVSQIPPANVASSSSIHRAPNDPT